MFGMGKKKMEPSASDCHQVVLLDSGDKKVNVINHGREITGLGLKEAKEMADSADNGCDEVVVSTSPCFDCAERDADYLREAGATVNVV